MAVTWLANLHHYPLISGAGRPLGKVATRDLQGGRWSSENADCKTGILLLACGKPDAHHSSRKGSIRDDCGMGEEEGRVDSSTWVLTSLLRKDREVDVLVN